MRATASGLLRLNPDYPQWVDGVAAEDQAAVAFLKAATLPDALQREAGYVNDGKRPDGPDADRNGGYQDLDEHRYWHYAAASARDIHQPLHAVSRFTRELPDGDLGGNRIRWCTAPCRLTPHQVWDAALGYGTPSDARMLAGHLPTPPSRRIIDPRVQDWPDESGRIAREVVYQAPIGQAQGPAR